MLELLKVFNSRTCQLVLGAGAMQVGLGGVPKARPGREPVPQTYRVCLFLLHHGHPASSQLYLRLWLNPDSQLASKPQQVSGLKSITAKHLAISCQCLGALMALHPTLFSLFMEGVMPPRRDMLAADFGRVLQVGGGWGHGGEWADLFRVQLTASDGCGRVNHSCFSNLPFSRLPPLPPQHTCTPTHPTLPGLPHPPRGGVQQAGIYYARAPVRQHQAAARTGGGLASRRRAP